MSDARDLMKRLKAADRSFSAERMSRSGSRRVARRLSRELEGASRSRRVGWIPMLTFVAGAALVLLFLRWSTGGAATPHATPTEEPAMTVHVTGAACRSESGQTTQVWGSCSIATTGPTMSIDTIEASHLEVDGRVVSLRTGSALFDVDKVRGEPIRISVPQGEIVVVGTRFRVVVSEDLTEVELYEGRLEFRGHNGQVTPIFAGQLVGFGTTKAPPSASPPPVTQVASVPQTPAPPPAATPAPVQERRRASAKPTPSPRTVEEPVESDAGPVIEEAERLRREGRYAEAASVLRKALERRWPMRTADVLSYELGRLLQRRLRDQQSACKHWRAHLVRFGTTRYRARIERSMQDLQCAD